MKRKSPPWFLIGFFGNPILWWGVYNLLTR